jgi:SpoIIAA-like
MIELIEGLPENIIACQAKGDVAATDYEDVLLPAIRAAFEARPKVRLYYELGPEFMGMEGGTTWEDLKIGLEHWSGWDRIAVVTDIPWISHSVNAFQFLMPCAVKIFPVEARKAARGWIAA